MISVSDKLEPESNDWSQFIFGSFRVKKLPLCDKIRGNELVKTSCQVPLCPNFFQIFTESFGSRTDKKKAVTLCESERTVIDIFFSEFAAHGGLYSSVYVVLKMKNSPENCDKHGKFSSRAPIG